MELDGSACAEWAVNNDFQRADFIHTETHLQQVGQREPPGKEDHPEKAPCTRLACLKRDLWKSFWWGVWGFLDFKKSKPFQAPIQVPSNHHWQNTSQAQESVIMQNARRALLCAVLATFYRTLGHPRCYTVHARVSHTHTLTLNVQIMLGLTKL